MPAPSAPERPRVRARPAGRWWRPRGSCSATSPTPSSSPRRQKPGEYNFVCTFPGHWVRMYGVMLVVPSLDALRGEAFGAERSDDGQAVRRAAGDGEMSARGRRPSGWLEAVCQHLLVCGRGPTPARSRGAPPPRAASARFARAAVSSPGRLDQHSAMALGLLIQAARCANQRRERSERWQAAGVGPRRANKEMLTQPST